jgi:hypothetical protein
MFLFTISNLSIQYRILFEFEEIFYSSILVKKNNEIYEFLFYSCILDKVII